MVDLRGPHLSGATAPASLWSVQHITPSVEPLGVTCAYTGHRAMLTLAGVEAVAGDRDTKRAHAPGRAAIWCVVLCDTLRRVPDPDDSASGLIERRHSC